MTDVNVSSSLGGWVLEMWHGTRHTREQDSDAKGCQWDVFRRIEGAGFPADVVEHVLRSWPDEKKWWPAWADLNEALVRATAGERSQQRRIAPVGHAETFSQRTTRLYAHGLSVQRMSAIGVGRWREIMNRHRDLTDAELLTAFDRLERGLSAFQRPPKAHDSDLVREGLGVLEGHQSPVAATLRRIGEAKLAEAAGG